MGLFITWMAWHFIMSLCVARTQRVGIGVVSVKKKKKQAYHRELTVRNLKHDLDTSVYMVNRSKEGTWSQVDQLSAEKTGIHSRIERNLQLSGTHDAWGTGQTDLMPCSGQQDSFFIPSDGETARHTLLHWAVSDSRSRQGWACGKSPWSLQKAGVGKAGQWNEKCLWWKTDSTGKTQIIQWNHTELDYNVKVKFTEHKGKEI